MAKFKRRPSDVVGVEIASSSVRVVRMTKANDGSILVTAAALLPAVERPAAPPVQDPQQPVPVQPPQPIHLPSELKGKYACLVIPGDTCVVKLLSFPGHFTDAAAAKVVESVGVENPDAHRISYRLVSEGHGKAESRVLAVAVPEQDASVAVQMFPAGVPAPFSVEVAPLAAMTAFLSGPGTQHADGAIGVIDFSDNMSSFALFSKGTLVLLRRFDVGTDTLLAKIQESLGVDRDTAQGIISDGSFDISQPVTDIMEPLVKQLIVSRDFVERRENCHVEKLYVTGGMTVSRDAMEEMRSALGIEIVTWNPLQSLTMRDGAFPENLKGQEWIFAAAVGACLGTFEETA